MYDRQWARSIVENYQKLYPRVQQIDLCLQQLYQERTGRICTRRDIQDLLVDSLQGKYTKGVITRLWIDYKRLIKKTPLDRPLMDKVLKAIEPQIDVDKMQRQFAWD